MGDDGPIMVTNRFPIKKLAQTTGIATRLRPHVSEEAGSFLQNPSPVNANSVGELWAVTPRLCAAVLQEAVAESAVRRGGREEEVGESTQ